MATRTLAGTRLGSFRVERLLGDGAMSEVYAAIDERLGRRVALKVLRPHLARSAEVRRRFASEARLASKLDHPNIVTVYDADEAEGLFYISMRLVEGQDLGRLIAGKGSLSVSRTTRFLTQAAAALDAAHSIGLIHRDVKPANILVARSENGTERLFLTDFGLTRMIGSDSRHTQTGQIVGSVHYMSPEQIEGREVAHLSDVYSLGCVLYECLTGRTPFEREADLAVLWAHVNAPVPPVSDAVAVPGCLDAVIERALAKDPEDRYQSCGDLARGMRSAMRRRHLPARRRRLSPAPYRRRVTSEDLDTGGHGVARTVKSLAFAALVLGVLATTAVGLARVTGVWTPGSSVDGDRSRLGTGTEVAAGDENAAGQRLPQGTRTNGTQARPSDQLLATGMASYAGNDTGLRGSDTAFAPFIGTDVPEKVSRTVTRQYNAASLDGYGQDCIGNNVGCVDFIAQPGERYVRITIDDASDQAVRAWLKRDFDADGVIDGDWVEICAATSKPVRVSPGAVVRIQLQRGHCGNVESTPTTGTVTAVFSNRT